MDSSVTTESIKEVCSCCSKYRPLLIFILLLVVLVSVVMRQHNKNGKRQLGILAGLDQSNKGTRSTSERSSAFTTNYKKYSIDLKQIRRGGPRKDGIPALNHPDFVSVDVAETKKNQLGIVVSVEDETRFYPYNIIVWHELVNDSIGDLDFLVSFCPLCGSGIVYDRKVDGETLEFGVSGMLFESNMLMFDRDSESLWSQSRSEAVVGDRLGQRLEVLPMQLMRFEQVREKYPEVRVLSRKTGYVREYDRWPYSGYAQRDELVFPVSSQSDRFATKQMLYVLPMAENSLAIPLAFLQEGQNQQSVSGHNVVLTKTGEVMQATVDGKPAAGYYEMWFSWFVQHGETGLVWDEPSASDTSQE